jgi:cation diffusion facilitator family transporter
MTCSDRFPFGHGREAYVWSLFAALGLFVAGATVSVTHGIQELLKPEPAGHFVIGYIVLAVSFALEAVSFLQSVRQARPEAESMQRDLIEHVLATSDPTLRAVFAEDSAALAGLLIAAASLGAHQLTGSPIPDAIGSIVIGVLLAVTAMVLINRNRQFLVGQEADPRVRAAAIQALLDAPEVARVTYLRLEIVGPRMVLPERLVGATFLGLGWMGGLALPAVWIHAGAAPGALMLTGGLLYTAGAISCHRRWLDRYSSVFGYHEVFHVYVCAAATCQFVAIALFIS